MATTELDSVALGFSHLGWGGSQAGMPVPLLGSNGLWRVAPVSRLEVP